MMMALGIFVFELPTLAYQQLRRDTDWRHTASDRVGARAARQYVGPGEDVITLSGVAVPPLTGSGASLETIRQMADEGRPLALVDGTGWIYGAFVIVSVEQTGERFFRDGAARRTEFQITLVRVDDAAVADTANP